METIHTQAAPTPAGHYAQALVHQGIVYVSGQLPIDPDSSERKPGTIEEEARRVLANLNAVLKAAGSGRSRVLRTTVYISDITLWDRFNAVYADFFGAHKPARTVVPTPALHFGFQVELDAVAAVEAD